MSNPFKKIGASAHSVFSRALHGEAPAARQEKERVIARIMRRSLDVYAVTDLPKDTRLNYAMRLHDALACARTSVLQSLDNRGIVVCLDARLSRQLVLPRGRLMHAVYAPSSNAKTAPVLMLRDDGRAASAISTFSTGASLYAVAPAALKFLARTLDAADNAKMTLVAGYYSYRSASLLEWRPVAAFNGEAVHFNREMLEPPAPSLQKKNPHAQPRI